MLMAICKCRYLSRHSSGAGSSHQFVVGCADAGEDVEGRSDLWQITNDAETEVFIIISINITINQSLVIIMNIISWKIWKKVATERLAHRGNFLIVMSLLESWEAPAELLKLSLIFVSGHLRAWFSSSYKTECQHLFDQVFFEQSIRYTIVSIISWFHQHSSSSWSFSPGRILLNTHTVAAPVTKHSQEVSHQFFSLSIELDISIYGD